MAQINSPDDSGAGAAPSRAGSGDPELEQAAEAHGRSKASTLFDLRLIIGGLFVVYGAILLVVGLLDGKKEIAKAGGIHINLWTGIAMLVVGLLFLLWSRLGGDGHDRDEG